MLIRLATEKDYKSIRMSLYNKKIDYITPQSAKEDIQEKRLYLAIGENGKIIGQCALKYSDEFGISYHAIQRLALYNKKNVGQHLTQNFIDYFKKLEVEKLGLTPWSSNAKMKYILRKNNFDYQYQIDKNFEFWLFKK